MGQNAHSKARFLKDVKTELIKKFESTSFCYSVFSDFLNYEPCENLHKQGDLKVNRQLRSIRKRWCGIATLSVPHLRYLFIGWSGQNTFYHHFLQNNV